MIKNKSKILVALFLICGVLTYTFYKQKIKNLKNEIKVEKLKVEKLKNETKLDIFSFYEVSEDEKQELNKISKSQIAQDIFVYLESNKKKNVFFVEFGATDGVSLSNSYMLENSFEWRGILAEPATIWHEALRKNRPNSLIETLCVWKDSNSKLVFNETDAAVLSTIDTYSESDLHAKTRSAGKKYEVYTISLKDMLKKFNAPEVIDYLSIDTEGSEYEILKAFFEENNLYKIKIITCEHNFTDNREKIHSLLEKNGYQRKYKNISLFDDFYVLKN